MPTLGYIQGSETEVAWTGSGTGHAAGNHQHFDLPAMPENGILDTVNFYIRGADNFDQQLKFFIADQSGNILWQSAAFNQSVDPSTTTADASSASLALTSGVRYKIGFVSQAVQSNARIINKTGEFWYNDPGTWSTVNDPVANVTPSSFGEEGFALLGHITYTTASTPTITDVDTDESIYPGQSFVITGTNFGATQGTGGVDIDGVAQTVTSWDDTSITCTAVRGGNEYGTGKTLTVTTDSATTATIAVAQEAEPNTFFVTAASPNTTDAASLWTGLVDTATSNPITIVDGDQAWVKNPNNLGNLSIAADGTITADDTGDFVVQIWLLSEGVWGTDQTVSFTLPSTSNAPIGKGNTRDMITFAAAGIVKGSYNERAIKYFRSNGATSRQYNHAEKQFEDN